MWPPITTPSQVHVAAAAIAAMRRRGHGTTRRPGGVLQVSLVGLAVLIGGVLGATLGWRQGHEAGLALGHERGFHEGFSVGTQSADGLARIETTPRRSPRTVLEIGTPQRRDP